MNGQLPGLSGVSVAPLSAGSQGRRVTNQEIEALMLAVPQFPE